METDDFETITVDPSVAISRRKSLIAALRPSFREVAELFTKMDRLVLASAAPTSAPPSPAPEPPPASFRKEEPRYSRRVEMDEITKNDFNLNISRYISTAVGEEEIALADVHSDLEEIEKSIKTATAKHNAFLKELGLPQLR